MSLTQYFAIVRHGDYYQIPDTPSANQPYSLTPEGEKQAEVCAGYIQTFCRDKMIDPVLPIHTSSSLRAWQTADILCRQLGSPLSLVETNSLTERSVGSLANLTIAEIERVISADPRFENPPRNWKSDSRYCLPYPGAESLMQAGQRVADYISDTFNQHDSANRLHIFVGHGAAFRHAAFHLGILSIPEVAQRSMYHAKPIFFSRKPGETWQHVAGEWKFRTIFNADLD